MNPTLLFEFIVNKENNTIHVKRQFDAEIKLVWEAWTNPKLLDQWWAPKPYQTKTKSMRFEEGGTWLYAMVGPDNDTHWCKADYQKINPLQYFTALDAFCDANGTKNSEFPRSLWSNTFKEINEITTVDITISYSSLDDLEKVVSLGFKEGFSMAMDNLDKFFMRYKL